MNQNKLFKLTRLRLALWYAIVMAFILSLCGFGLYKAVSHAHWVTLDREVESVAGTLHDSIELKLKQPGRLEPVIKQLLPNICVVGDRCIQEQSTSKRHTLSAIHQGDYYVRFFDNSGRLFAIAGSYPEGLSPVLSKELWQTLKDSSNGKLYHQISFMLHTQDNRDWGYIQVGRSLEDFNGYLNAVKLILALGLPIAMGLVGVASWWLAGLAMQPIYQSYKQIQQFTADVAHELRTPLAASQATVESALMIPQLDQTEARDILQTIQRQNQRLTTLVADLLLLSRLDRQRVPMRHECCLDDIISDLVEEFAAMAIAVNVKLTSSIRVHQPLNIVGNSEQLYRLVSNLIINAIQYTPQFGKVAVILDRTDHYAVIQVQDTGIGIPQNELTRIFDRFYRVNSVSEAPPLGGSLS
ncbi:two-component sensor histidine kinase [Kalymmatonema gypsitolerans NIES-4073]|nr:two-component sensor histidine kinase [Scytonema sp. NIES-4073]